MKKDNTGVAPLRNNGLLINDSKQKAEVLNTQYHSVFTPEDDTPISASFQSFGTSPSWMDLLKMLVNNGLNSGANSFRIIVEISSGPVADLCHSHAYAVKSSSILM
jgi:hypothetical protein